MKAFQFVVCLVVSTMLITACTKSAGSSTGFLESGLKSIAEFAENISKLWEDQANSMESLVLRFDSETDEFEKYKLCQKIILGDASQRLKKIAKEMKDIKNSTETLNSKNKYEDAIQKAGDYCQSITDRVAAFEEGFTEEDWSQIAAVAKKSELTRTKKVFRRPPECSHDDVKKILASEDKTLTTIRGMAAAMVIVGEREQQNFDLYIPLYEKVVLSKDHPDRDLVLKYMAWYMDRNKKYSYPKKSKELIAQQFKKLSDQGSKDVEKTVNTALKIAPHCFAGISMSTINNTKIVMNENFMKEWKKFFNGDKKNITTYLEASSRNDEFFEVKYEARHELEKLGLEAKDAYGRPFLFRVGNNQVDVITFGKDKRQGTEDDVSI